MSGATRRGRLVLAKAAKNHPSWKLIIAVALMFGSQPASAQIMSSSSYVIPFDAFSDGGGHSTSASFITEDTVTEQGSPTGEDLSSASYLACVGYECLFSGEPSITVDISTQTAPCTSTSVSTPPYTAPLGTLSTSAVSTSANRICVVVSTDNSASVVVQGTSANAALKSVSSPGDSIPAGTATLTAGVEGYGFCSSQAANGFTAVSPYNGSCDMTSGHAVGLMDSTPRTIWSATGALGGAYGELLTKASISGTVPAHDDYADTLTLIVTGTF